MRGKWALITGASSGIGRATAERFAKEGINLLLVARRKERLEQIEKELGSLFRSTYVSALRWSNFLRS